MRTAFLACVYYLVVTPIGLIIRLARDPLHRRWIRRAGSYWCIPAR